MPTTALTHLPPGPLAELPSAGPDLIGLDGSYLTASFAVWSLVAIVIGLVVLGFLAWQVRRSRRPQQELRPAEGAVSAAPRPRAPVSARHLDEPRKVSRLVRADGSDEFVDHDDGGWVESPLQWDDSYELQTMESGTQRLAISPSGNATRLMVDMARSWRSDCWLLYVLMVERGPERKGRYQSPTLLEIAEASAFVKRFRTLLETDARHEFWMGQAEGDGLLVYENHGLLYAYGELHEYVALLETLGFRRRPVAISTPHVHHFNEQNDHEVQALLTALDWVRTPLQEDDGA